MQVGSRVYVSGPETSPYYRMYGTIQDFTQIDYGWQALVYFDRGDYAWLYTEQLSEA